MKNKFGIALLLMLAAGLAFGAREQRVEDYNSASPAWFRSGLYIGPASVNPPADDTNKLTRSLAGSITFDFASVTITCEDSTGITITGAQTGDPCFVGPPTTISGAGTGLHSNFTCYVSAADTVKVRHCAAGTADNPASATFKVRVLSNL